MSGTGVSATIVPRTIHAPVRISAPPSRTMVPPFICKPAKSFTGPLTAMTPAGMFAGYPQPQGDPFDPEKAKQLLVAAGYRDAAGNFDPQDQRVDNGRARKSVRFG